MLGSISSLLFGIVATNVSPFFSYLKSNLFSSASISSVLIFIPNILLIASAVNSTVFGVLSITSCFTVPDNTFAFAYFSNK